MSTIDVKYLVCPVCGGTVSSIVYTSIFSAGMTRWSNGTVHSSHGLPDTFRYMGCPHCRHVGLKQDWERVTSKERVVQLEKDPNSHKNQPLSAVSTMELLLDSVLDNAEERKYFLTELFKKTGLKSLADPETPHSKKYVRYTEEYINLLSKEPNTPENLMWRAEVLREMGRFDDATALAETIPKDNLTAEQRKFVDQLIELSQQKNTRLFRVMTQEEEDDEREQERLRKIEKARDPVIRFAESIDGVLRMFPIKVDKMGISTRLSDNTPCVYIYMSSEHDMEVWHRVSKQIEAIFTGSEFRVGGENNLVVQATVPDRFKL